MTKIAGVLAGLVCAGWLIGVGSLMAQAGQKFQVGSIDFFGGQGMDTSALLAKVPVRVGQTVDVEHMEGLKAAVNAAVLAATGRPDTNFEVVCCDQPGKVQLYVGLEGSSYRAPAYASAPTGDAALPDDGLALYRKDINAVGQAVQSGNALEDDTKGYALTKDPAANAIELRMRAYALQQAGAIERVLRESKDAEQRQAAAMLLGYAERSKEQLNDLAAAANDVDADVRNNAVRALEVLAVAQPLVGLDVKPFVAMLYSGQWTDRNKVCWLLFRITQARDPRLLEALRRGAMGPLVDGARWHSIGHAIPFLVILGRIGGMGEAQIKELADSGARDEIIAAAQTH